MMIKGFWYGVFWYAMIQVGFLIPQDLFASGQHAPVDISCDDKNKKVLSWSLEGDFIRLYSIEDLTQPLVEQRFNKDFYAFTSILPGHGIVRLGAQKSGVHVYDSELNLKYHSPGLAIAHFLISKFKHIEKIHILDQDSIEFRLKKPPHTHHYSLAHDQIQSLDSDKNALSTPIEDHEHRLRSWGINAPKNSIWKISNDNQNLFMVMGSEIHWYREPFLHQPTTIDIRAHIANAPLRNMALCQNTGRIILATTLGELAIVDYSTHSE